MGDLIGKSVEGTLYHIAYREFQRVLGLDIPREQRAEIFADMCRLNALYMIASAGSGHIGSSFSSVDIVSWLFLEEMTGEDVYFSSKGHDAPGYYAALTALGKIDFKLIHKLRRIGGLPGHPDIATPGVITNTGSLGMGVSKAKGMVLANRMANRAGRVFVMTGDGELQEGQFWESLASAVNLGLHEITVIVDHNKLQSDTFVKNVSDLGDLEGKLKAFGWRVERCDGNDMRSLSTAFSKLDGDLRPKIIIADTVKGKGVSFMEHTSLDSDVAMYRFHSGAPDAGAYDLAAREIMDRLKRRMKTFNSVSLQFEANQRSAVEQIPANSQRLVAAYSRALVDQADKCSNLVALDADLVLDTGLIPFKQKYPNRLIECGIAEQDMVSMAGGMALNGLLPVVHSFSCFLSSRPHEQIYNNATEGKKIVYVGSLAGVLPAGPGHSHQSVRDVSALAAMPNLVIAEPSCEQEVASLLDWMIGEAQTSCYLRLQSISVDISFSLPDDYKPKLGHGVTIVAGVGSIIITAGPMLLEMATKASKTMLRMGHSVQVINFPWLNNISDEWLSSLKQQTNSVLIIENHTYQGGFGQLLKSKLSELNVKFPIKHLAIDGIPPCGSASEVLDHIGFTEDNLVKRLLEQNH